MNNSFCIVLGYLMYEFNRFWFKEKPASIMEFNYYREQFHKRVKELLLDHNSVLILKAEKQWIA